MPKLQCRSGWHITLVWLAACVPPGWCGAEPGSAADVAASDVMTRQVDQRILDRLRSAGVPPGPPADDSEFLRRASLDLTGVIPSVAEVREFLSDRRARKRELLVDRLLASPRHATHLAITWRRMMLPADFDASQLDQAAGLQSWLRQQFVRNLRYDRLVAEFLSSTGDQQTGPALFYRSLNAKPEKLAAATSRIFLGLQIQCAECHDHPFDHWKQRDFWGYAAFFAQLQPDQSMRADTYRLVDLPTGEVRCPRPMRSSRRDFPWEISPATSPAGHADDNCPSGWPRVIIRIWRPPW